MKTVQIRIQNDYDRRDVLRGLSNAGYFVRSFDCVKDEGKYEKQYFIEIIKSDGVKFFFDCDEFNS